MSKVIINPIYESPVFIENITATEDVVINQGGTWSGKTFSIMQVLLFLTLSITYRDESGRIEPIITTVVGQDVPNLKKGAITDFNNAIDIIINTFPENCRHFFEYKYHGTDKVCTFANKSKIEFSSFKDWQDAKSGKRHLLFINEANGISFKIAEQLMFRTKIRVFLDYNPDAPFWVHHNLIGKEGVKVIYSNLSHNKFTPEKVKRELIEKGKRNPNFKKVYLLGKTGQTEGVVFPNVNWVTNLPDDYERISYGLDFGYSNDPTALVEVRLSKGMLFVKLLVYETKMLYKDIANAINENEINTRLNVVYCDNDERAVDTLLSYDIYLERAKKGPGSILQGVQSIKEYDLNIVNNIHFKDEQLGYKWKKDRATGANLKDPIDDFNHAWDALRYAMQGIISEQNIYIT